MSSASVVNPEDFIAMLLATQDVSLSEDAKVDAPDAADAAARAADAKFKDGEGDPVVYTLTKEQALEAYCVAHGIEAPSKEIADPAHWCQLGEHLAGLFQKDQISFPYLYVEWGDGKLVATIKWTSIKDSPNPAPLASLLAVVKEAITEFHADNGLTMLYVPADDDEEKDPEAISPLTAAVLGMVSPGSSSMYYLPGDGLDVSYDVQMVSMHPRKPFVVFGNRAHTSPEWVCSKDRVNWGSPQSLGRSNLSKLLQSSKNHRTNMSVDAQKEQADPVLAKLFMIKDVLEAADFSNPDAPVVAVDAVQEAAAADVKTQADFLAYLESQNA